MSHDPARGRFFLIQLVRLAGVGCVLMGLLASNGRLANGAVPTWAGYLLLIIGLVGVFVIPTALARKWRTPR
ncbi:hypothetical protein GGR39_001077 [Novosphingobium fluoreni]|uniref:Uncharacterized protein n=1 Tax=Novosphingobium fluoreni TaxID=1391222 RepID=A0A7W6FYR2_9SPHN|nr:hypothetical protein [uncultured Novosphingobium sp.]KTR82104.1 hypothetical protein NS277_15200 [Novosphingobium barchaimii]MBB3939437.1 hypothetical protein [Novosphingobium fluoreni]